MSAADQLAEMAERIAELEQDSALLDALERMVLWSAEAWDPVVIDGREHGVITLANWKGGGEVEYSGADLRAAIRAAMEASTHE